MQFWLFPSESPIPEDARPVPNFGDDYLITPDGEVWSNKWAGPRRMKTFEGDGGPRVCLWRYGRRYCPDVDTLLRRVFERKKESPEKLISDNKLIEGLIKDHGLSHAEAKEIVYGVQAL